MELSKTKMNIYATLGAAKMRRKHGLFVAEGRKCVSDLMRSFSPVSLIIEKGSSCESDWSYHAADAAFDVCVASPEQMNKISNLSTHTDVIGIFKLPERSAVADYELPHGLYMMLDGVQDPGNLGTIIRTCHWFGISKIFASHDTVDVFNPKTLQATMGSAGRVEVIYCNLGDVIDANPSLPVYGTLLEGTDIFSTVLDNSGFIVMGNEGKGLSDAIRAKISKPLFIPPASADHPESLNVSIAAAIVLSQFVK